LIERSKNPYRSDKDAEETPMLVPSVVAYIDILGYKELVDDVHKKGEGPEFIVDFRKVLDESYKMLKPDLDWLPFRVGLDAMKNQYVVRGFSDNIVIGYPFFEDKDTEPHLRRVFDLLALFQLHLVLSGFFLRGAIAFDELYVDDDIIFGKGFLEAVKGEQELSRDPRIILTNSAEQLIKANLTNDAFLERSSYYRDLFEDADGKLFLNYLECILIAESEIGPSFDHLLNHKTAVEKKLQEHISRPNIWSKYQWVANYHNFFCEQYPQYFDDSFKINLSAFQMRLNRFS
jgi:hypothetical protein